MRTFTRLATVGFLGLMLGLLPSFANASGEAPLKLDVTTAKATYAAGEPVELKFTVTNQGSAPCQVVALPDGTVDVTAATKDGNALAPSFGSRMYYFGYDQAAESATQTVNPGASVSFALSATQAPGQGQESMALPAADPLPDGDGLLARWPVASEGKYSIQAAYALASGGCAGSSNVATVAFTVGAAESGFPWIWVYIGGGALLLALLVIFLLRKGRRTTAAAVLLVMIAGAMSAVEVRPANAALLVDPDNSTGPFAAAADACLADFALPGHDPANLMSSINDPSKPRVTILPRSQGHDESSKNNLSYTDGPPAGTGPSDVYWTETKTGRYPLEPGLQRDACAELYHELSHAHDIGAGTPDQGPCSSTVSTRLGEVRATLAENAYRANAGRGLSPHTTYDGPPLPKAITDCKKPDPKAQKKSKTCKSSATGHGLLSLNGAQQQEACDPPPEQAATSDGDPHLRTFDHKGYDFQAVGEFVTAKSGQDLEIQTRQSPVEKDRAASLNSAAAMRVGADRVGFYLRNGDIAVNVNTAPVTLSRGDFKLPGGGVVKQRASELPNGMGGYTVRWPDGSAVWLDPIGRWGIRVFAFLAPARAKQVTGLLGNFDGDPANDLVSRDGKAMPEKPSYEELYRTFGDSWRVGQAESLFDYGPGGNTDKFTDRGFPDRQPKDIPEAQREAAKLICQRAGVIDPALLDGCVLDVVTTGQPTLAVTAGDSQEVLPANASTPAVPDSTKVVPGGTIRDGATVVGEVKNANERNTYDLVLDDTTRFSLVDLSGDVDLRLDTDGNPDSATIPGPYQYGVTKPGTYKLEVTLPDGRTGPYSFRVVARKVRTFPAKIGDDIKGRLDTPGRVDVYAFDVAAGQKVAVTGAHPCEDVSMGYSNTPDEPHVYTPGSLCWGSTSAPDEGGKLALVVWSEGGKPTDYGFKISAE
jgi:VWD domain-containing protein